MNIWLTQDGENLPVGDHVKKMRTWMLGEALSARGHQVTWWASNFLHIKKEKVSDGDIDVKINDNFQAKLIDAGIYKKNISFQRILQNRRLAKKFYKEALKLPPPDIIIASMPSLDLVHYVIKYGQKFDVPVIVDIRDMWPDIFKDYFKPGLLKIGVCILSWFLSLRLAYNLRKASALAAVSNTMLDWGKAKIGNHKNKKIKSRVFYLGYDEPDGEIDNTFQPHPRNDYKDKIVFIVIGILGGSYDLESIIRCAKVLQDEDDNRCHFIIAGDGPKRKTLETLAADLRNVTLSGWVNKEESSCILKQSDVYMIPSLNVTVPNRFFEALYFGLPILHSLEGEVKKVVEEFHAGCYYEKKSDNQLLENIKLLRDNRDIAKTMAQNSKELYKKMFNKNRIYDEYCDFIKDTTQENK